MAKAMPDLHHEKRKNPLVAAVVSASPSAEGSGDMDVAKKPPWMDSRRPPPGRAALTAAHPEASCF